ncbi:STAS domain-containing protein [Streptomyces sp. NPDC052309]|uniref:STAS domain-containing protein n=1 Tax=Streptomyces griseicoloratus TaxID=2752516 RepID=A0A926QR15_9ACTN|nr:STAS domain-containing protein [Streptomyces griseicoloratus]MBD0420431.1 STAS domain-containing protein [Streptomyces griseicoloratus]
MSFEAYLGFTDSTATVYLSGDLTDKRVPALRSLVEHAVQRPLSRLVLRMTDLESISAGGVRCLAFAQQQLPQGADIVVDGAGPQIRQMLRSGGFDQAVTLLAETPVFDDQIAA